MNLIPSLETLRCLQKEQKRNSWVNIPEWVEPCHKSVQAWGLVLFTFYYFVLLSPPPRWIGEFPLLLWPSRLWLSLPWMGRHLIRWKSSLWKWLPFTSHSADRATRFPPHPPMNHVNFLHRQLDLQIVTSTMSFEAQAFFKQILGGVGDRRKNHRQNSSKPEADGGGERCTPAQAPTWTGVFDTPMYMNVQTMDRV